MANWYLIANTQFLGNNAGNFVTGYAYKGVLHTTEGSSASGAINAYTANNSWPHFTVDRDGTVYQHIALDKAARALQNLGGGKETNRGRAIQLEVVGFAHEAGNWPSVQATALKSLMRWIEAQVGIQQFGPIFGSSEQYGYNNPLEFGPNYWQSFNGWCGHQHVPENSHWDPGAIVLTNLFGNTLPQSYFEETPMPFTVRRQQGGHIVVGTDGGIFTYDGAPFYGSIPGLGVSATIVGGDWTPDGGGYWLLGHDGAIFSFGNAAYKGGFNALPPEVRGGRIPVGLVTKGNGYVIRAMDPSGDGSPFDEYAFGV